MDVVAVMTSKMVNPANPRSLSAGARRRRWAEFRTHFPDISAMRVLDLGGTAGC